jgi:mRNA-degrading endonuclease YafQ of YafQ-DinJ toxin-antitoxin module
LLEITYTTKFKKDFKKQKIKLTFEDLYTFYQVIDKLKNKIDLEPKFSDHPLEGAY